VFLLPEVTQEVLAFEDADRKGLIFSALLEADSEKMMEMIPPLAMVRLFLSVHGPYGRTNLSMLALRSIAIAATPELAREMFLLPKLMSLLWEVSDDDYADGWSCDAGYDELSQPIAFDIMGVLASKHPDTRLEMLSDSKLLRHVISHGQCPISEAASMLARLATGKMAEVLRKSVLMDDGIGVCFFFEAVCRVWVLREGEFLCRVGRCHRSAVGKLPRGLVAFVLDMLVGDVRKLHTL
jgi:hypothetical protein